MSLHLSDEEIRNYHQQNLPAQQLLKADLHITECEDCQSRLREVSAYSMTQIVQNMRQEHLEIARLDEDHILYEQLEFLVDGKLEDVDFEIVQSHLEVCEQCSNEAEELRSFRKRFDESTIKKSSNVIPWHRSSAFTLGLRIAGVAAMIVLFVWVATLPMRDQLNELQARLKHAKNEIARLELENSDLVRQSNKLQTEIAQLKHSQSQIPIIASLIDGGRVVSVDQKGNIAGISVDSPPYMKMAKDALTKQTVETPAFLASLIGKQSALLGSSKTGHPFKLIAPVGTALQQERPNFRWKPFEGAIGYRVRVYDTDFREVAASEVLKKTTWTPSKPFQRGRTYSWIVTGHLPDKEISSPMPPAPEARFMMLDSSEYEKLKQVQKDFAQSHLLLGLVYAKFGLLDDSIRELQQLVDENPDSQIARNLLNRVQSLRKDN